MTIIKIRIIYIIVTIDIIFEFVVGYNLLGLKSTYPGRIASFTGDEMKIGAYFYGFLIFSFFVLKTPYLPRIHACTIGSIGKYAIFGLIYF